jgi:hypothetical protein
VGSSPVEASAAPDDADDLRGHYFKQLLAKPLTQALIAAAALLAGIAGAAILSPAIGAATFFGGLLLGLLVTFLVADSRSEDAFFEHYAAVRQMHVEEGKRRLDPATPLLRKGDDRYAERLLEGPLGERVEGLLALYTYEEETTDSKGNRQTSYYRYTVGIVEVRESVTFVPELICQRKFGLRALEKLEDAFRSKERVKLESGVLDERYEIFVGKGQNANWLRQLFSPTFIVWLTESAPEKLAFELDSGMLCCYVKGHRKRAEELDAIRAAAAAVATRLREESLETL